MCHSVDNNTPPPVPQQPVAPPPVQQAAPVAAPPPTCANAAPQALAWPPPPNLFSGSPCGCSAGFIPPPSPGCGTAPQGQGLTQNPDGSVSTAGGYKIVAEGKDAAWDIYGPQGNQLSRIWGDPHVADGDGKTFNYTKSSNFVLPDGTRIAATSSAETGHPTTQSLDIANGMDRVQINGVNGATPRATQAAGGVPGWTQQHASAQDTFSLHTNGQQEDWVRFRNGQNNGVVTGSQDLPDGSYDQTTSGAQSALPGIENNPQQYAAGVPQPQLGGFPSFGGLPQLGGFPSFGGLPQLGGFPSFGGLPQLGGLPSLGGFDPSQLLGGGLPSLGGGIDPSQLLGGGGLPSLGGGIDPSQLLGGGGLPSLGGGIDPSQLLGGGGLPSLGGGIDPSQLLGGGIPGMGQDPSALLGGQLGMPGMGLPSPDMLQEKIQRMMHMVHEMRHLLRAELAMTGQFRAAQMAQPLF